MNRKLHVIIVAIIGNLFLAASKVILSFFTGSLAIGADGFHSFTDLLVSLIVLTGYLINKKPANDNKKRIRKIESIVTLIISFFIIGIAVGFFFQLWFRDRVEVTMLPVAIAGQGFLIILTYILFKYKNLIGTEEKSQSIVADSHHTRADMLSSIGVFIALLGSLIGLDLDRLAAFGLFFIILYQGLEMLIGALRVFFDKDEGLPVNFRLPLIKKVYIFIVNIITFAGKKKKLLISGVITGIVIFYTFFSFTVIDTNQRGVLFLFGKVINENIKPGLFFDPAFPVTELVVIDTSSVRTMRIGYRLEIDDLSDILIHQWETIHISNSYSNFSEESEVLTGDGNLIHVSLNIDYVISNAIDFILTNKEPELLMRELTGALIRKEFGKHDIFSSMLSRREDIENNIQTILQSELDKYKCGIKVENIVLFDLHPPEETAGRYRNVFDDEEYYKIQIYNAEAYRETQLPYARGLVKEIEANARSQSKSIILKANQEVILYDKLERAYIHNSDEVVLRTVLQSWVNLLADKRKIVFFKDISDGKIRLDLSEGSYLIK
ncbi:MAG: cation diffusion facilitator family transporter [Spirochaetales bacterium]|nr:cation diffusion facilitator family transporter [Spirochaetales bacterium]